jgi:hypothetical protein
MQRDERARRAARLSLFFLAKYEESADHHRLDLGLAHNRR